MLLAGAFRDRLEAPLRAPVETPWRSNLVVWSALDLIGALLCNRSTGLTFLAVGSGDPAWDANPPPAEPGRTRLTAEVFRTRLRPGKTLTYDPQTGRVHVRVSIGRGLATGTLRELGLFGGNASARPGSGTLVNHSAHPPIQKGVSDTLERELFLTLEPSLAPGARDLIGGLLARRSGLTGITHVALGTGGDTPAEPPRELVAEAYRKPLAPGDLAYDASAHAVDASASFEIGEGPASVLEAGLFGGTATDRAGTGFLVVRATGAAVDRREPKRLERRFRLVLVARTDVAVPALVGQTLDAARQALGAGNLSVGSITNRATEADPAGNVLEQSPEAGAVVNEGTPVALVVAVPPTVVVPEIVGEPESQAKTLLKRLGFTVLDGARVEQESTLARGTVLAASPPPRSRVPKGTGVAMTVAVPVRVDVPDVRGRTPAAAAVLLRAVGLAVAAEPFPTQESSASPGTVVAQKPAAGLEAETGTAVQLTLAIPWAAEVPDVRTKTAEEAASILAQAAAALIDKLSLPPGIPGLLLGAVTERPNPAPVGTIIEQRPAAGARASLYTTVDVVVASIPTARVPRLVGLSEASAVTALTAAGFTLGTTTQRPADAVPGTVVDQDPNPGFRLPRGGRVAITLAVARRVVVPDLVGFSFEAAREEITGRGLALGTTTMTVDGGVPGTVLSQDPPARQAAAPGAQVNLVVVAGVPNVVGMSLLDAQLALQAVGVPVVSVDHTEVAGPPEIVLSQSPPAGSPIDASTQMSLVVSMPRQVQVPAIVGSTLEDAKPVLDSVALLLDVVAKRESDQPDQPEGSILEQDPAAGTPVDRGSAVHVTIAVARPQSVTVPDLAGRSSEEAKALLAQAGLVIEVAGTRPTPGAQPDSVVEQNPRAGESVPPGTTVTVVLASADATVEVPEVRRLAVDAARTALGSVSLQLQVSGSTRSVDPEGTVLTQDQLPGSRVPAGSVVSVVVSAGGLVVVPGLIGMSQGGAVRQLELVNLVAEVTEDFEISRPPGTVIDQHPGAGEQVEPQTTVVLVVAIRRIGRPPVLPQLVQPEIGPPRPDVLIRPEISLRPEPLAPVEPIPGSLRLPQ